MTHLLNFYWNTIPSTIGLCCKFGIQIFLSWIAIRNKNISLNITAVQLNTWKICLTNFYYLYNIKTLNEKKNKTNNIVFCCRIIEIAGGREVFSQSRGKVAARKPKFLVASNTVNNETTATDNKLSVKKNTKSPNRQSVWELRSR